MPIKSDDLLCCSCEISIYLEIIFHKYTWLQGTIVSNTKAELTSVYDLWFKFAKEHIQHVSLKTKDHQLEKNVPNDSQMQISSSVSSVLIDVDVNPDNTNNSSDVLTIHTYSSNNQDNHMQQSRFGDTGHLEIEPGTFYQDVDNASHTGMRERRHSFSSKQPPSPSYHTTLLPSNFTGISKCSSNEHSINDDNTKTCNNKSTGPIMAIAMTSYMRLSGKFSSLFNHLIRMVIGMSLDPIGWCYFSFFAKPINPSLRWKWNLFPLCAPSIGSM